MALSSKPQQPSTQAGASHESGIKLAHWAGVDLQNHEVTSVAVKTAPIEIETRVGLSKLKQKSKQNKK